MAVVNGTGNDDLIHVAGDGHSPTGSQVDIPDATNSSDTINAGPGDDEVWAGDGSDVITSGGGNDVLNGDLGSDTLHGGGGDDTLDGGSGSDNLFGDAGIDTVTYSFSGSPAVFFTLNHAGSGGTASELGGDSDILHDIEKAVIYGSNNDDTFNLSTDNGFDGNVSGGLGNDNITTGAGADRLTGGDGNDTMHGGGGSVFVAGSTGSDLLVGGGGVDFFDFQTGDQSDTIADFTDGQDLIDLSTFGFANAAQAMSFASQVGTDVVFDFGGGDVLTLANVALTDLGDPDFIF